MSILGDVDHPVWLSMIHLHLFLFHRGRRRILASTHTAHGPPCRRRRHLYLWSYRLRETRLVPANLNFTHQNQGHNVGEGRPYKHHTPDPWEALKVTSGSQFLPRPALTGVGCSSASSFRAVRNREVNFLLMAWLGPLSSSGPVQSSLGLMLGQVAALTFLIIMHRQWAMCNLIQRWQL